jgi:hypothetical protein
VLVPGPTVQFQQFVGHQVEVTGMIVPAGDSKTKTETRSNARTARIRRRRKP